MKLLRGEHSRGLEHAAARMQASYVLRRSRGVPAKRQDCVVEEEVLTSEPHPAHSLQSAQVRFRWGADSRQPNGAMARR